MNIDLDEILDTPVQTSLFVDCFDDLMDSLSSDFPMNGEFDSILADLHQSSTVLTPEPSPLMGQNVTTKIDLQNEITTKVADEKNPEIVSNILHYSTVNEMNIPSVTNSLEQFDAMMYLSGNSPPPEIAPCESLNYEPLPTVYPPGIVGNSLSKQDKIDLDQIESKEIQNSVTQQTLLVQSAGQQFEIGISFSIPSEKSSIQEDPSTQQTLTDHPHLSVLNRVGSQEPVGSSETMPQAHWALAATPPMIMSKPNSDDGEMVVKNVVASNNSMPTTLKTSTDKYVFTNYYDNYQKWLNRSTTRKQPIMSATQNMQNVKVITIPDKQTVDHMIIEEQPAASNVESLRNYVHIPNSYVINSDGISKTFIVHEVYKVADSKKRSITTPEQLHELSQPNRKRPRKSAVIYNTDFLCVPCQKTFGKKGSLKQHIRSYHSEPLPFHCDTCGKNFATADSLARHVVNHDQRNKKFKCSECEKRYVHSKDRDRHFLTHHGVPAHTCRHCSMAFARRDHLLAHEITHERRQSREALAFGTRKVQ